MFLEVVSAFLEVIRTFLKIVSAFLEVVSASGAPFRIKKMFTRVKQKFIFNFISVNGKTEYTDQFRIRV
ncbi:MAG TPA: hypothetical protein DDW85_07445 [Porphyromonadaceae bacterium]|nr:hypothetical protein [Porphyromonadaceae bacterium]